MNDVLDPHRVPFLHLDFQKKIQVDLFKKFKIDPDNRLLLLDVDFRNTSFSPDFFGLYFTAIINKSLDLNAMGHQLFVDRYQDVTIHVVDPSASIADRFFTKDPMICPSKLEFTLPDPGSTAVLDLSTKLRRALALLMPIQASCVNAGLLNSIAIFMGNELLATSATTMAAQGRIYVKVVHDHYPGFYYLDMIIHELSHLYFNMINHLYPLVSDYTKTFFSAARNMERPILGIFNGTFVLYRLITVYRLAGEVLKAGEVAIDHTIQYNDFLYSRFFQIPCNYEFRLTLYVMKFKVGLNQLLSSDSITVAGRDLLIAMSNEILDDRAL